MSSTGVEVSPRRVAAGLVGILAFARLALLIAAPPESLRGFGDFPNFIQGAALPGWPFLQSWSEFPPVFPFVSELIYRAAGGQPRVYDVLLVLLLTAADAGSLLIFYRLAQRWFPPLPAAVRAAFLLAIQVCLPYHWWYFDPLAVFFLLAGLACVVEERDLSAGLLLAVGILTKVFPGLALAWVWRSWSPRRALRLTLTAVLPVALVYAGLYLAAPEFTTASLRAQSAKGSWETVWALLDGNVRTGNFGPYSQRLDPAAAGIPMGNPAVVDPIIPLAVAGALGLVALLRFPRTQPAAVSLVGLAFCLLFLASPGWSPQWCLYLLPLLLLALPLRQALLFGMVLILVNLLEWPLLLSRGRFDALYAPILLRTVLLGLAGARFFQIGTTQAAG